MMPEAIIMSIYCLEYPMCFSPRHRFLQLLMVTDPATRNRTPPVSENNIHCKTKHAIFQRNSQISSSCCQYLQYYKLITVITVVSIVMNDLLPTYILSRACVFSLSDITSHFHSVALSQLLAYRKWAYFVKNMFGCVKMFRYLSNRFLYSSLQRFVINRHKIEV